jgi:hypothetical protein
VVAHARPAGSVGGSLVHPRARVRSEFTAREACPLARDLVGLVRGSLALALEIRGLGRRLPRSPCVGAAGRQSILALTSRGLETPL